MTFTAKGALDVLRTALAPTAVILGEAKVLQEPADNAMIALPNLGLVARIGVDEGHTDRLRQELRVASWLVDNGLPTPAPAVSGPTAQCALVEGRVITWWEYLPSREHADLPDLMRLIRDLHSLAEPRPEIAAFDPWARVVGQIAAAQGLSEDDRDLLRRRWEELRARWARSRWPHEPPVVIHGDVHVLNTLVHQGKAVLLDLEDVRLGPWQWDAISPLVHYRAGWIDEAEYRAALASYGRDPACDPEVELLVSVRMLRMTCWLASRTGREPELAGKVRHRIENLHDSNPLHRWSSGV